MKTILTFLLLLVSTLVYSQEYIQGPSIPNTDHVWLDAETLEITYIKLRKPEFVSLRSHEEWLKDKLGSHEEVGFVLIERIRDYVKQSHYRYQQTFKGYPVEGSQYIINKYKGKISSINGNFTNIIYTNPIKINKSEAYLIAKEEIPMGELGTESNQPKLVIFNYILCYKFDIFYPETQVSVYVYINAETGKIANKIRQY